MAHHHLTELVKVHGSGTVLVQLLQDALQLFLGEGGKQFTDQASQGVGGDVAQTLLVIYPEDENVSFCILIAIECLYSKARVFIFISESKMKN